MGFQLGQGVAGHQRCEGHQLPQSVIQGSGVEDIPKDVAL